MKIKDLKRRHPSYQGVLLEDYLILHEGGERWEAVRGRFLPRRAMEMLAVYNDRKRLASYRNEAAGLLDDVVSHLFSDELRVDGLGGEAWWADLLADCDLSGTSLEAWAGDRLLDALVTGASYTLADLPASSQEPVSALDAERSGLTRPYLTAFTAAQLVNWERDAAGLVWALFEDQTTSTSWGESGPRNATVNRWTLVDRQRIVVWTAPTDKPDDTPADLVTNVEHRRASIPLAELRLPPSLHAMRQLRDALVELHRARNRLSWSREVDAYSMLFVFTDQKLDLGGDEAPSQSHSATTRQKQARSGGLSGGEGGIFRLNQNDDAKKVSTDAHVFATLEKGVEECLADVYRLMRALMQANHSDALQQQSGESKAADWRARETQLGGYEGRLKGYVRQILRVAAEARGSELPPDTKVQGLASWRAEDLMAVLEQLAMADSYLGASDTARRIVTRQVLGRLVASASEEERRAVEEEVDAAPLDDPLGLRPPSVTDTGTP